VREGTIRPLHTPGVCIYYTRSIHLCYLLLTGLSFVEVSDSQKQSINDAFQYVVVPPFSPASAGMNVAKIQINIEKTNLWTTFLSFSAICPKIVRLSTQVEKELAQFLGFYLHSPYLCINKIKIEVSFLFHTIPFNNAFNIC